MTIKAWATYVRACLQRLRFGLSCRGKRLFDFHDRMATHIGDALSVGTTLTTRLWVGLLSVTLGVQVCLDQPSLYSHTSIHSYFHLIPAHLWGATLTLAGALMLWRTVAPGSRPWVAWVSNSLTFGLWSSLVLLRIASLGYTSLASSSTVIALMAGWLLMRTEATTRDRETA